MKKENWLSMILASATLVAIILGIPSVIINLYVVITNDGNAVVIPDYIFFSLSFIVTLVAMRIFL